MEDNEKTSAKRIDIGQMAAEQMQQVFMNPWNSYGCMTPIPNSDDRNIFICPQCKGQSAMQYTYAGYPTAEQRKMNCRLCHGTGIIEIIPAELGVCDQNLTEDDPDDIDADHRKHRGKRDDK